MESKKDVKHRKRKIRMVIIVNGNVQRVGYREYVHRVAIKLGITGYVENLRDDSVRIVAESDSEVADKFLDALKLHSEFIDVEKISVQKTDTTEEFRYFEIKRDDFATELIERLDTAVLYLDAIRRDLRDEIIKEIREQIATLRQERLLLYEKEMLSDMHEHFIRYDIVLHKILKEAPYEKSVFIMMPFDKNDIRLNQITNTIRETLKEHGLYGWRADDPNREVMEDIWDNIVVNMLSCKYGIAVFVDKRVLDRYTDREITVFNANIALEVGFMKSRGLNVLILKDKRLEKLPTDIISKLYEEFDFNNPEGDVKKAVKRWIEKIAKRS